MTQMVTRCPKCATAFRITSTQLESAKGSVRCGSCLHIFKAQDYLVNAPQASSGAPKTPSALAANKPISQSPTATTTPKNPIKKESITVTPSKAIINKNKVLEDEDDTLISDDMDSVNNLGSGYDSDSFLEMNLQPKQSTSLFEREIRYDLPKEKEHIDESWADELLDDDKEPPKHLQKQKITSTEPKQVNLKTPVHIEESKNASNNVSNSAPHSAAPTFSFVNEDNAEQHESEFSDAFVQATSGSTHTQKQPNEQSASFAAALFNEEEDNDTPQPLKRQLKSSHKIHAHNNSRAALLMNIMPAPIEFTARKMRHWYQKKLWSSLAFIAAIALFYQVAYFKFDYFSRIEPYRTAYVLACPLFNCKVPSLVDTDQIVATNLIVHNNSNIKNSLIVDAIIINKAPFDQPFPNLILVFSTLDDTPITSRSFSPQEYLAGELAGIEYIPSKQPVHISLDIVDPGPEAVNYHMLIAH